MKRVDTHIHFWKFHPAEYPWMSADMQVLKRDRLPADVRPCLDRHGIDLGVAVQARMSEEETEFLLELSREHPWVAAVIGWVDLRASDLQSRIDRWRKGGPLAGFRHILQGDANARALVSDAEFRRGVATLQKQSLLYEVLISADQLPVVTDFCRTHDNHWLVLDHLGKPDIRNRAYGAWLRDVTPVAALPHVVCKLSGMVTEANDAAGKFDVEHIRDYLDAALELFGPKRLMFGSDWSVCLLAAEYDAVVEIVEDWSSKLGAVDREWIWGGTAEHVYGLRTHHG